MKHYFPKSIKTLVAIDGSINNWKWLKKIKEYINPDNCKITFIAVPKSKDMIPKAEEVLKLTLDLMQDENFLFMHEHSIVKVGDPVQIILDYAHENNFDLIIVGSHNKTAVERFFMGSVSSNVVIQAPIPVLVMKM